MGAFARRPSIIPLTVVVAVSGLLLVAGWRGSDYPAQIYRADLFRRAGFVLWDGQWYGGHSPLGYSLIGPAMSALLGPFILAAASGAISTVLFDQLLRRAIAGPAMIASIWFGLWTTTNLIVGRTAFALGLMCAIAAGHSLQRGRTKLAATGALLASLSSPVAGLFMAVAGAAWAASDRSRRRVGIFVVFSALVPIGTVTFAFPSPGFLPYEGYEFAIDIVVAAALFALVGRARKALRWGIAFYAALLVASFVMATPLGRNASRLGQALAGPVVAVLLWERRRVVLMVLAIPLCVWQWGAPVQTIASRDASVGEGYFQPLTRFLESELTITSGRVEIPFTRNHWESAYVAPKVTLARGWERQLDFYYNREFYDGSLTAQTYHQWLRDNGVEYVTLPDAPLDSSSVRERELLLSNLPYLTPIWRDAHWSVWRVDDYAGLIDGPALLLERTPTSFTLMVYDSGTVTARFRPSPHWKINGSGCTEASSGDWTQLNHLQPGVVKVTQAWNGTPCG